MGWEAGLEAQGLFWESPQRSQMRNRSLITDNKASVPPQPPENLAKGWYKRLARCSERLQLSPGLYHIIPFHVLGVISSSQNYKMEVKRIG